MTMYSPERLAQSGTEEGEQTAFFAWLTGPENEPLRLQFPGLAWAFAVPNGDARGDDSKSAAIRGARLKKQGVKAGVFDIFIPQPVGRYHGLFIEMKCSGRVEGTKRGVVSDDQTKFGDCVARVGYGTAICYTWIEARDTLLSYLYHAG